MAATTLKIDKLPTIRRLPSYLHLLRKLSGNGIEFVSSGLLAKMMNLESILVRKDFELAGISGTPRVGYHIPGIINSIEDFLGWGDTLDAFLVGTGQLGAAILGYKELENNGHRIVAAFDKDPLKCNRSIHDVPVFDVGKAPDLVKRLNVRLAILTVPTEVAQEVTDFLVESGIRGIWNFTSAILDVPEGVSTQKEDLLSGLAVLSMKMA
jgi:redox-sensing transcriptional repressor